MILSKSSEKVVWELNELLAAQQRARNFSRATLNGEIDARPNQFVPQSWDNLSESAEIDESATSESEAAAWEQDEHAGAECEDTHVEEVVQTAETLAEEAYKRGFEEGHAAGVQEELARAQDSDRAFAAIFSKLDALPPMWSQLVDLSLEVAEVTSLGVLSSDLNYMRDFINKTLVKGEIDPTQLVSIKVSEKIYMMLQDENNKLEHDGRELPVEIDTSLADLDVGVEYEFASIERRFSEQLSQVRDQLLSQVPFAPVTEDDD
jgi:flagellar biosynthesis/type III secretory pathway protein FliH